MRASSYRSTDWMARRRSGTSRRAPWLIFALGFVLGALIF